MPPKQKPGKSEQVVVTPMALIRAVARRFGPVVLDLAATAKNTRATTFFGPPLTNSLALHWESVKVKLGHVWWINPPFDLAEEFARKCHRYQGLATIALLTPASVSTNWYLNYVDGRAAVEALNPRPTFEGHGHMYPKDMILSVFHPQGRAVRSFRVWKWLESSC